MLQRRFGFPTTSGRKVLFAFFSKSGDLRSSQPASELSAMAQIHSTVAAASSDQGKSKGIEKGHFISHMIAGTKPRISLFPLHFSFLLAS